MSSSTATNEMDYLDLQRNGSGDAAGSHGLIYIGITIFIPENIVQTVNIDLQEKVQIKDVEDLLGGDVRCKDNCRPRHRIGVIFQGSDEVYNGPNNGFVWVTKIKLLLEVMDGALKRVCHTGYDEEIISEVGSVFLERDRCEWLTLLILYIKIHRVRRMSLYATIKYNQNPLLYPRIRYKLYHSHI